MRLQNKKVQNLDELLKSTVGEYEESPEEEKPETEDIEGEIEETEDEEAEKKEEKEEKKEEKAKVDVIKPEEKKTEVVAPVTSVAIKQLEARLTELEGAINMIKNTNKVTAQRLENVEKNIEDLLSIYELVTNQINPFIDEQIKQEKLPREEKAEKKTEEAPIKKKAPKEEVKTIEKVGGKKVLLDSLDLSKAETVADVIEWLKFLISKVGHQGLERVLDYYVVVGWISEDVKQQLITYSKGIRVPDEPVYDTEVSMPKLDAKDHEESLRYIGKIKGFVI
ncbi:hypothetical protein DRN74_01395 [Candidatus Micrarchaeota archaeon]|nr:MAG: hypothetical protein DRN74_01395 [Candidatus Micrarchaeota archaeon]